jgi:hypothetical protein
MLNCVSLFCFNQKSLSSLKDEYFSKNRFAPTIDKLFHNVLLRIFEFHEEDRSVLESKMVFFANRKTNLQYSIQKRGGVVLSLIQNQTKNVSRKKEARPYRCKYLASPKIHESISLIQLGELLEPCQQMAKK